MKDILMVTHFTQVPGEKGNGRFHYIANMLANQGMKVEILTTQFSHRTKRMREINHEQIRGLKYKLTMVKEPGYRKNVTLRRFYSHYIMGRSVRNYLNNRKKPDIIYCSIPSIDVANEVSKYAKKHRIRLIIDVQDIWPEAFKMVFNVPILSNLVFKPMEIMANNVYKRADEIVAVSQTYVDRALSVNNNITEGKSIFLGTDIKYFDKLAKDNKIQKKDNKIWIIYIGTLGNSYDLIGLIEALYEVKQNGISNLKLMVLGDGPLKDKFESYAKELDIDADFMGRLDYGEMVGYLKAADIAINPIKKGAAGSIINKVGDYAAAGLPVINTQESKEYREILEKYNAGINCKNGDKKDLVNAITFLYTNCNYRKELGCNNRKLAEDKFDRDSSYKAIISMVSKRGD